MAQDLIIVVDSKKIPKKDLTTFSGKHTSDIDTSPTVTRCDSYFLWAFSVSAAASFCNLVTKSLVKGQGEKSSNMEHSDYVKFAHLKSQKDFTILKQT